MEDLPNRTLLGEADVDRISAVIHNLLTEIAVLSQRVSALESTVAGGTGSGDQAIDALTSRVLHPFLG